MLLSVPIVDFLASSYCGYIEKDYKSYEVIILFIGYE